MNINLWFARDIHTDEIVSILDAKQENKYCCPICNSEAIPKALESKKVTPHFAHIDRSKCSSEAMIHWWYKHRFIEAGDTFTIKTDKEIQFTCKSFKVEKEYKLSNGVYKPDLVVYTECGNEIVFEMANTNKKKVNDYIDQWIELGKIIVEVDIKSMVNDNKTFNALYYNGKCFNFNKRDGGYYNSIGKLKEKLHANGNYDIEKIRQLDWLWKELSSNEINNDIYPIMEDVINNDELKYLLIDILKNSTHKRILDCFNNYLKNKLIKNLDLSEENPFYTIDISKADGYKRDIILDIVNVKLKFLGTKYFNFCEKILDMKKLSDSDINNYKRYFHGNIEKNKINMFVSHFNELLFSNCKYSNIRMYSAYKSLYLCNNEENFTLKIQIKECELNDQFWMNKVELLNSISNLKKHIGNIENGLNNIYMNNSVYFDVQIKNEGVVVRPKSKLCNSLPLHEILNKHAITLTEEYILSNDYTSLNFNKLKEEIETCNYLWKKDKHQVIKDIIKDATSSISKNWNNMNIFKDYYNQKDQTFYITIECIKGSNESFIIAIEPYNLSTIEEYKGDDIYTNLKYNIDNLKSLLFDLISKKIEESNFELHCKECGESFYMNGKELKFYLDKGYILPKRCKSCRQKRKVIK